MARRDARHGRRRRGPLLALVLLLVLATIAAGAWRYDLLDRWVDGERPVDPVAVAPPDGLDVPPLSSPAPVAEAATAPGPVSAEAVRAALAPYLADPDLGGRVAAAVAPLEGDGVLVRSGGSLATPASLTKIVTGTAALLAMDPATRFETRVVADGERGIVLVGGGDPFLASRPDPADEPSWPARADVTTLARETAAALEAAGQRRVRVGYDASLFTGPAVSPQWRADYVRDGLVSPVSALWVEEGRPAEGTGRVEDPARTAATVFAGALSRAGIEVVGVPRERRASPDAAALAAVRSAPLSEIVEQVLVVSDNEAAEVLLRHVGLAAVGDASFSGGRTGAEQVLAAAGVDLGRSVFWDGSGLSRQNRAEPTVLLDLVRLAAAEEHPELRSALTGLPVAGFTGSLSERFDDAPAEGRGRVRAKTGTLTGVTALAGIVTDLEGRAMVFVLLADRVAVEDTLEARDALDGAAAALGACRCG